MCQMANGTNLPYTSQNKIEVVPDFGLVLWAPINLILFFYLLRGIHFREDFAYTISLVIELLAKVELFSLNHLNSWTMITASRKTSTFSTKPFNYDLSLSWAFLEQVLFFKYSIDHMPNSNLNHNKLTELLKYKEIKWGCSPMKCSCTQLT